MKLTDVKKLDAYPIGYRKGIEFAIKTVSELQYGKGSRRALDGAARIFIAELRKLDKDAKST